MNDPELIKAIMLGGGTSLALSAAILAPEVSSRMHRVAKSDSDKSLGGGLSDRLRYRRLVRQDVVQCAPGSYLAVWEIAGRDMSTMEEEEVKNVAYQVALTLGVLPVGTIAQFYERRELVREYDRVESSVPALELLDELRAQQFLVDEPIFGTKRYVALTWLPPQSRETKSDGPISSLGRFLRQRAQEAASIGLDEARASEDAMVAEFQQICARVEAGLASALMVRRLGSEVAATDDHPPQSELLAFVAGCVTGRQGPVNVPPPELPLNALFAEEYRGGYDLRVGTNEVSCIEIRTYPHETMPGILDTLAQMGVAHLLTVRFIPLTVEASRTMHRGAWADHLGAATFRGGFVDPHAAKLAAESIDAFGAAAEETSKNGLVSIMLVLRSPQRSVLNVAEQKVLTALEEAGFIGERRTLAAQDAWLSTLPGEGFHGIRKHPLMALNVAHLFPLHAVETGRRYAESESLPPRTPAVTYALGPGSTASRVHLHGKNDLGHGFICGPSTSGKSVAANFLAASFAGRIPDSGVTILDKGRSSYRLTHMVDGVFYDLLGPNSPGFALFEAIEQDDQARAVLGILGEMLELWGVARTPVRQAALEAGVRMMLPLPRHLRSMTTFVAQLQDPEEVMRPVFERYTGDGVLGRVLDCTEDSFDVGRFNAIDIERVLQLEPKFLVPILRTLVWKSLSQVRRMRAAMKAQGRDLHWLFLIDEAHAIMKHPIGEQFIVDLLKTGRKENILCWLISNSPVDYAKMAHVDDLLMNSATRIFFGDPGATDEDLQQRYADLQLPAHGRKLLPYLKDREFLYHQPGINLLQRLSLSLRSDVLSVVGTSRGNDRVDEMRSLFPKEPYGQHRWKAELLKADGVHKASARLEQISGTVV